MGEPRGKVAGERSPDPRLPRRPEPGARGGTETASAEVRRGCRDAGPSCAWLWPLTCGVHSFVHLTVCGHHSVTRRRGIVIKLRVASRPLAWRETRRYLKWRVRKATVAQVDGFTSACECAVGAMPLRPSSLNLCTESAASSAHAHQEKLLIRALRALLQRGVLARNNYTLCIGFPSSH
ncbi:hypothetical protein HJG60_008880 [Phyllostomus discolor]|uniref:Uncharacterized protein n=1 Tax=Phyllostomus discolor TaxID=89673 RepID=A0A833YU91_9CHIR|nr:hypothetical protein HJG60_008880 [Phyllostomus discolor]